MILPRRDLRRQRRLERGLRNGWRRCWRCGSRERRHRFRRSEAFSSCKCRGNERDGDQRHECFLHHIFGLIAVVFYGHSVHSDEVRIYEYQIFGSFVNLESMEKASCFLTKWSTVKRPCGVSLTTRPSLRQRSHEGIPSPGCQRRPDGRPAGCSSRGGAWNGGSRHRRS